MTVEAFPAGAEVFRFIRACRDAGIRFKETAGLHHPVRGEYRLAYADGSPSGTMFGYLNLLLAAVLVWGGHDDDAVLDLLEERDQDAIRAVDDGMQWRGLVFTGGGIARARAQFALGFGSCSFREPLDELTSLAALP